MNDNLVQQKIREIVAKAFRVTPEAVTPETSIFTDLTGDSLAIVELIMAVEDELHVTIPDEEVQRLGKIGDLANFVRQRSRPH